MKRAIILFMVTSFVALAFAQPQKQSVQRRQGWENTFHNDKIIPLFGDIESITIVQYSIYESFGEIIKSNKMRLKEIYNFNKQGDVVEYKQCKCYHSPIQISDPLREDELLNFDKWVYNYDSAGRLLGHTRYNPDGSAKYSTTFFYDGFGNRTEMIRHDSDGALMFKRVWKYDASRHLIRYEQYSHNGSLDWVIRKFYSPAGLLEESSQYRPNGTIDNKIVYEYDSSGLVCYKEVFRSDGSRSARGYYTYDSSGNLIKTVKYLSPINFRKTTKTEHFYKYDHMGNIITEVVYSGDLFDDSLSADYITEYRIVYRD